MEKEEFVKNLGLLRGLSGKVFDIVPECDAHEFVMAIYLGKEGCEREKCEYLYGRLMMTDLSLLQNEDWRHVLRNEYEALLDDMYETAQEKFGKDLPGIVSQGEFEDTTDFDRMLEVVAEQRLLLKEK